MDYEKQWKMLKETIECMVETLVEPVGTAVECNGGREIIYQSENPALNALCILCPLMTEMEQQKPQSFADMIKCYEAVPKENVIEINKTAESPCQG